MTTSEQQPMMKEYWRSFPCLVVCFCICNKCVWVCKCVSKRAEEEYLHSQTVIRHRHTGVAVPAHVHGRVGTVVCLLIQ